MDDENSSNGAKKMKQIAPVSQMIKKQENVELNYLRPEFRSLVQPQQSFQQCKRRFLYKPFVPLPNLSDCQNHYIEVRVHKIFLTKQNRAFIKKQFWGTDTYTSDSDMVCILQHQGFIRLEEEEPRDCEAISVYLRVVKGKANYNPSSKNGIKSNKMGQYEGHGIKFERAELLPSVGNLEELSDMAAHMPQINDRPKGNMRKHQIKARFLRTDLGQKVIIPTITFNLSLEPAQTYNLGHFGDKGGEVIYDRIESVFNDEVVKRTSNKLNNQVLYIETSTDRYEVSRQVLPGKEQHQEQPKYKFVKVKAPMFKDNAFMKQQKLPLQDAHTEVLFKDLDWHDLEWGEQSVMIKKKLDLKGLKSFKYFDLN